MEDNLYQSPEAELIDNSQAEHEGIGDYKLFKISGIGLATFFAGLPGGGFLLAQNFKRQGQHDKANKALGFSIVGFFLILVLGFFLPESIPNVAYTVTQILIMVNIGKHHQEQIIFKHRQHGQVESNWKAFGISLLVFLVEIIVLGVIGFGIYFAAPEATMAFLES